MRDGAQSYLLSHPGRMEPCPSLVRPLPPDTAPRRDSQTPGSGSCSAAAFPPATLDSLPGAPTPCSVVINPSSPELGPTPPPAPRTPLAGSLAHLCSPRAHPGRSRSLWCGCPGRVAPGHTRWSSGGVEGQAGAAFLSLLRPWALNTQAVPSRVILTKVGPF